MKLSDGQRSLILSRIESLFETVKAKLLGRHFKGPSLFFEVARRSDPLNTIEGVYQYTLSMLYGTGVKPNDKTVSQLTEITGNYIDAQQLKIKNHILADVNRAKTPSEAIRLIRGQFEKTGKYIDLLVSNEVRIAQAYASKEGITKLASDIGVFDPTVVFLGVTDHKICKYCKSMYHDSTNLRKPKPYKLSQLQEGYFKPKEWDGKTPHQSPLHPRCFDKETEVLTNNGWKLFKNVTGDELFLSMNMNSGLAEWQAAVSKVEYHFSGELIRFQNHSTDLMVTPNHMNPIFKRHRNKNGQWLERRLVDTNSLLTSGEWGFITAPEGWEGKSSDITLDGIAYDRLLMSEFMGYFLSEGCVTVAKTAWRIEICQYKYPEPMIQCVKKLFKKDAVYYKHGKIIVWIPKPNTELFAFLGRLRSWEKKVPNIIKEGNTESLRIFLNAYLLGDGSVRSRVQLPGQRIASIERVYHTSSKAMADDLGEILLKIGKRPSYTLPREGRYCNHHNGVYKTQHPTWLIRENNPSSPRKENLTVTFEKYQDFVYDVELVQNHTLFVRRNGKVQLSGNCRHHMSMVPPHFGYSDNGTIEFKSFDYDYYKDFWSMNKSEEPTGNLAKTDRFIGYDEYLTINIEHEKEHTDTSSDK